MLTIESNIKKMKMDSTVLESNGKFKLDGSQVEVAELDKEKFLLRLDEEIYSYGLQ